HFDAFHMYGIIGSAVIIGIFSLQVIKKRKLKSANQTTIEIKDMDKSITRYIVGGTLFGLGWALIGACPGPLFILIGYGYLTIGVVIVGALMGTFVYGLLKTRLPH
ncbi:MAG: putative membrane protein YedE/YeeE, partial [Flavobacteriales bacterium]